MSTNIIVLGWDRNNPLPPESVEPSALESTDAPAPQAVSVKCVGCTNTKRIAFSLTPKADPKSAASYEVVPLEYPELKPTEIYDLFFQNDDIANSWLHAFAPALVGKHIFVISPSVMA